jgi:uncharacterized protein YcaQ
LEEKVEEGLLEELRIDGIEERYFMLAKNESRLYHSERLEFADAPVKFLTPFDNILRQREFPSRIWNFDYKIECYVPVQDRVYGYFVLPILDKNHLGGRLDAKVHRKEKKLEIKAIYLESDDLKTTEGLDRLQRGIEEFAQFHDCELIQIGRVTPRKYTKQIRSLFK